MQKAEQARDVLLSVEQRRRAIGRTTNMMMINTAREELGEAPAEEIIQPERLTDVRARLEPVITPELMTQALPITRQSQETVSRARRAAEAILKHENDELMVVVGPCSIHDMQAALEYSEHVARWDKKYPDLAFYMRYYTEKPRTPSNTKSWKGISYDPRLDGSDDISLGMVLTYMGARQITHGGVALAAERLHADTPQYLNGMVALDTVGARDSRSQGKHEYGSATSSPIGYKNTLEGDVEAAVKAAASARLPHSFLGMDMAGLPDKVRGRGNPYSFVILRGGKEPNYGRQHVRSAAKLLRDNGLEESVMIDASHGNSDKQASRQVGVIENVCGQLASGEEAIRGVMIESNLRGGRQDHSFEALDKLIYGQSITDECVDLQTTEAMLEMLQSAVFKRRERSGEGRHSASRSMVGV